HGASLEFPIRHGISIREAWRSGMEHLGLHPLRDLDLTTLRLFVSVCEHGNIARAGERANIVGSAISKRLAQLEDQVGTALLVRKRHGVVPTPAGHTLLEHARGMLDGAARIERDMQSYVA